MPQFHDSKRCGRTLKRLFEMAKYPNCVYVGLTEQTDPDRLMMIRHVYKNIVHSWDILCHVLLHGIYPTLQPNK